jgi:hypothetical protein
VTDSLYNSGAFSNPNAVRDCPFNLKGILLDLHEIIFSFVKKIFCWAALKSFKNKSAAYEKNFPLRDKNHAPFKLNGQSRTAFGLLPTEPE